MLVLPALFDEANKLRRLTVEAMRRLDAAGIDAVLPDLPGCNESLRPLSDQTLEHWREAARAAAAHFGATHVLALRGGALVAPSDLPGWAYAPVAGRQILRAMLRARTITAREAGREETIDGIQATARAEGIELAGWALGPAMFTQLEAGEPDGALTTLEIAGAGLWLRAEPDESRAQAEALAAAVVAGIGA
ncbi:hypothetical protein [Pelagerythrobacter sp.]|uniref:hypothetical protein n=1 Tax=Pelagerythrobacter sp. TaxID=2800702 RepID=UPI0035ADF0BD